MRLSRGGSERTRRWICRTSIKGSIKDDPDDNFLQLAYTGARWLCRRSLTTDGTTIDTGRVEAALTKARQALLRRPRRPPKQWVARRAPGVSPRCPRTAINSQQAPPAATYEREAGAGFEPATNAREHARNA